MARKKKVNVPDVIIFVERCDFCENCWPSHVAFYDVVVKGFKTRHRVCEFCNAAWSINIDAIKEERKKIILQATKEIDDATVQSTNPVPDDTSAEDCKTSNPGKDTN